MVPNLVSVIIPTFGGAEFLERCVDSVLAQTYKDLEVIVVDDNGLNTPKQKETANVMQKYASVGNVKYVCHQFNRNGSAARNTGVANSDGEYIALLDDDDVFLPEKIHRQVTLLSSLGPEYGAVYCSHETFLRGEKVGEEHAVKDGHFVYEYMTHQVEIASTSLLIRRSAWEDLNGFDDSFRRHQDWEFVSRLLVKYAIKSQDFYGFERILQFRNSSVNPKVFKERRLYYLQKMDPILQTFSKEQRDKLLVSEYIDVVLAFIKAHKYMEALKEFLGISPRLLAIKYFTRRVLGFVSRGAKMVK